MTETVHAPPEVGIEVMIPTADKFGQDVPQPLAPRLASLENRRIALLWNGKPNGNVALTRIGEMIEATFPGSRATLYAGSLHCEPALLDQVREECEAVVACTAD